MKTPEQIRELYIKKVEEFSYKQDKERSVDSEGKPKDRTNDIYVTDICGWDTYCPKQVYFNKVCKKPALPEALIRFTIGHVVHEIPLWDNEDPKLDGHEQAFNWKGIRCRMDEINFEDGIIIDKKTAASLGNKPKDYVTKQLNIYRVIAEDNEERPTKINQLFVINLAVLNGKIQVLEVPMWDKEDTIAYIDRIKNEIETHVKSKTAPYVPCGSKGWICEGCQYKEECSNEAGQTINVEDPAPSRRKAAEVVATTMKRTSQKTL